MPDFVVHEHEAERAGLHYDLRFDVGGTLESWAIPKGIPMKYGKRHLAIKMPNHPIDYKDFSGRIEEGYGKGDVRIWDEGEFTPIIWEPDSRFFNLRGDKIAGNYYLRHWRGGQWLIWRKN